MDDDLAPSNPSTPGVGLLSYYPFIGWCVAQALPVSYGTVLDSTSLDHLPALALALFFNT